MRETVMSRGFSAAALLALGVAACATGAFSENSDSSAGDPGGAGGDTRADAGPDSGDAGAPSGDAVPAGAVSFFQGSACAKGWAVYSAAAGRFLLPTIGTQGIGTMAGAPLDSGEDRQHTHGVTGTWALNAVSFAGIAGGGNHGVAAAGEIALSTTSEPASMGLPYVQLLVCKKVAAAVPRSTPLPSGMLMFFDAPSCPSGWQQSAATQGRSLVGLPEGAPADLAFGGAPLSDGEARSHAHRNEGTLSTTPHGIALASGCCGGGYAQDGTSTFKQDTDKSETGMPWLELLHCQKK